MDAVLAEDALKDLQKKVSPQENGYKAPNYLSGDATSNAFVRADNPVGWDRTARYQRAVNMARDKMGVSGIDEAILGPWATAPKESVVPEPDRRRAAQANNRRSLPGGLMPCSSSGYVNTIVELRTSLGLKEHVKRNKQARESNGGIQLATLEVPFEQVPAHIDLVHLSEKWEQRRTVLGPAPMSPGTRAPMSPADRALKAWTAQTNTALSSNDNSPGPGTPTGDATAQANMFRSTRLSPFTSRRFSESGHHHAAGGGLPSMRRQAHLQQPSVHESIVARRGLLEGGLRSSGEGLHAASSPSANDAGPSRRLRSQMSISMDGCAPSASDSNDRALLRNPSIDRAPMTAALPADPLPEAPAPPAPPPPPPATSPLVLPPLADPPSNATSPRKSLPSSPEVSTIMLPAEDMGEPLRAPPDEPDPYSSDPPAPPPERSSPEPATAEPLPPAGPDDAASPTASPSRHRKHATRSPARRGPRFRASAPGEFGSLGFVPGGGASLLPSKPPAPAPPAEPHPPVEPHPPAAPPSPTLAAHRPAALRLSNPHPPAQPPPRQPLPPQYVTAQPFRRAAPTLGGLSVQGASLGMGGMGGSSSPVVGSPHRQLQVQVPGGAGGAGAGGAGGGGYSPMAFRQQQTRSEGSAPWVAGAAPGAAAGVGGAGGGGVTWGDPEDSGAQSPGGSSIPARSTPKSDARLQRMRSVAREVEAERGQDREAAARQAALLKVDSNGLRGKVPTQFAGDPWRRYA